MPAKANNYWLLLSVAGAVVVSLSRDAFSIETGFQLSNFVDLTELGAESYSNFSDEEHLLWAPLPRRDVQSRVEFGTSVDLSADGTCFLTGTPKYDYKENYTILSLGGGAIFFYCLNINDSNKWELMWSIFGAEQQGLGEYISLSPSGQLAAAHHGSHVQVYTTYNGLPVGKAIYDLQCPFQMGATILIQNRYLTVSCPSYMNNKGKVNVYELDENREDWNLILVLSLESRDYDELAQTRFGWRVALDETATTGHRRFRIAISAPNFQQNLGLVRVYDVFQNLSYVQVGKDLLGDKAGDQFGFDLSISETSDSTMVIGVPQCDGGGQARGCARVYSFQRSLFNGSYWQLVTELNGINDQDRLGRNVVITRDAGRVALAVFRYDRFTGLVQIYDRVDKQNYSLAESLVGKETNERWGSALAMSATGAVVAASSTFKRDKHGLSVGSIRVLVDVSPFCGLPFDNGKHPFLDRALCRDVGNLVQTEEECLNTFPFSGSMSCRWMQQSEASNSISPTTTPSILPSESPSIQPPSSSSFYPTSKTEEKPAAASNSHLVGCACDVSGRCVSRSLKKGQNLGLCISSRAVDIELVEVTNCRFTQGSSEVIVINNTEAKVPGASYDCSGELCIIRSPLDSSFFEEERADRLTVSGVVVTQFTGELGRRGLLTRRLNYDVGKFSFVVGLDQTVTAAEATATKNSIHPGVWAAAGALVLFALVCLGYSCKMKSKLNE